MKQRPIKKKIGGMGRWGGGGGGGGGQRHRKGPLLELGRRVYSPP